MIFCNDDLITIFKVIKAIYGLCCMAIGICFIFSIIIVFFKKATSQLQEKIGQLIAIKIISLIILFLLPNIIFFVFNMIIPEEIIDVNIIKNCWHLS